MKERPPFGRRWLRRGVKWALRTATGLALFYLVAINVFLRTRLFRNLINFDPESFRVEYASAYSIVPGRIHVEGLTIRGKDSDVEWLAAIDRCDFAIVVTALFHHQFHAEHVRGDGVAFRARLRVGLPDPEHDDALPPIAGFPNPPLADVGPPPAEPTDAEYKLWGVRLDDVDAKNVREVWVDTIRATGALHVHGSWTFQPLRAVAVGAAIVDAHELTVDRAGVPFATNTAGSLNVTVHPFDPRVPNGLEVLRYISVVGALTGTCKTANLLRSVLDRVDAQRGEGVTSLDLFVDHGVLGPGTHLETEALDSAVGAGGGLVTGAVRATFDVAGDAATVAARLSNLVAQRGSLRVDAARIELTLRSRDLDLSRDPFADSTVAAKLTEVTVPSLSAWSALLPPTVKIESGTARVSGNLVASIPDRRGHGEFTFAVDGLRASHDRARLAGSARGDVVVTNADIAKKEVELGKSHVELEHLVGGARLLEARATLEASVAKVTIRPHELDVANAVVHGAAKLVSARGRVLIDAPSLIASAPTLVVDASGRHGVASLDLPRATLPDLAAFSGIVSFPKDVELQGGRGAVRAQLDVDVASLAVNGNVALAADDVTLRLASDVLRGRIVSRIVARRRGGATSLDGTTFSFDGVPQAGEKNGWWTRVGLGDAELSLAHAPRFRSKIHLSAQNGSPIAAMVADSTPVPKWVIDAVPMNDLRADADVRVAPESLQVRSLTAHGGTDTVQAEYASLRGATAWALSVEAGPVRAGFHVADGKSQLVLFGVQPWFESQVVSVKAREEAASR
jgi:hypothetical protein